MTLPPCGALYERDGSCTWRVWAPHKRSAQLVLVDGAGRQTLHVLQPEAHGCFALRLNGVAPGQRYWLRVDHGAPRPDPASRAQPEGVHAASAVVDLAGFPWTDAAWRGVPRRELAIYELHVGAFTPAGTFDAIIPRLAALRELGVTALELMPVAQFPGVRGWGYDGVGLFAVQHSYGGAEGLQRLVDAAHAAGLGVILDVVYNHLGPEGNYVDEFGPYFSDRHHTPWGRAVNFDDRDCEGVRAWVLQNVQMWIRDFHLDGLRLDAVHALIDDSPRHIVTEICDAARAEAAVAGRTVHVIAESDLNDVRVLRTHDAGGWGLDAQWNDDFHHAVHALLTGERNGYYQDFDDPPRQIAQALRDVFVRDGGHSRFRQGPHGAPAGDVPADRFVVCVQNHDQVGNRAGGERLSTLVEGAQLRLAAGLLLLSPYVPLLFMGEEYGEQRPFPFFCNFSDPGLQKAVRRGRRAEFAAFGWSQRVPDPLEVSTWASAKLSWSWPEGTWQAGLRRLYQTLLHARRAWPELQSSCRDHLHVTTPTDPRPVLSVRRSAPGCPTVLELQFNLTGAAIPCGDAPRRGAELVLRSEDPQFGGAAADVVDGRLGPFEFLVWRRPGESRLS